MRGEYIFLKKKKKIKWKNHCFWVFQSSGRIQQVKKTQSYFIFLNVFENRVYGYQNRFFGFFFIKFTFMNPKNRQGSVSCSSFWQAPNTDESCKLFLKKRKKLLHDITWSTRYALVLCGYLFLRKHAILHFIYYFKILITFPSEVFK